MPTDITKVNQENYHETCFPVIGTRHTTKIEPYEPEKWIKQFYDSIAVSDSDLKEKKYFSVSQEAYYKDKSKVLADKRESIEDHVDRRIQLFFQQAILCFNTPFFFKEEQADDQIGQGKKYKRNGKQIHSTEAAHSSTLPCLHAYPKDAQGNHDEGKKFVFLKHSHAYKQHNATVELPVEVNKTDSLIDGAESNGKLRTASLRIINQIAEGTIGPVEGTRRYLLAFERHLMNRLREVKEGDRRSPVLNIYLEHVQEVRGNIQEGTDFFDQILGVILPENQNELRSIVYKRRYDFIQKVEYVESQIMKEIFQAQKLISKKTSKSMKNVDYRLRYALLEKAVNERDRKFYERLFCCSLAQLRATVEANEERLRKVERPVRTYQNVNNAQIDQLFKKLSDYRRQVRELEVKYRSELFKGLRKEYREWTQEEFANTYRTQNPDDKMSQTMVSRLEQPIRKLRSSGYKSDVIHRRKELTIEKAQKIAGAFGIDAGLFVAGSLCTVED